VTLNDLIQEMDVAQVHGDPQVPVSGLALDSRRVRRGDLFFGLSGLRQDGGAFVEAAFAAGACGAVVARGTAVAHTPVVEVEEPRLTLAQAACSFHGHPSRALIVAAVTGTNGKTTTTWMLESIFRAAGLSTGRIGTTGYRIGDETRPAPFTTPEAPELQGLLREMADDGVRAVAIEVSSHALDQRRSWGLECDVAIFTNLTQDHLDYHRTPEAYREAKLRLFDGRNAPRAVKRPVAIVNADDPAGARVCEAARRGASRTVRYGEAHDADLRIAGIEARAGGLSVALADGARRFDLRLPLLGRYNAWNAAAAFAAARALGLDAAVAIAGLAAVPAVPGRLERVTAGQPFEVLVDYAHTPDALARALAAAREHAAGNVLLVFGCGGDRDRAKRPLMGRVAAERADRAWVTNDNPRSEDPAAIAREITAGAPGGGLTVVLDRRTAIAAALEAARPGDVVLIAGKGHETTQTVGDRVLPFDDREVARALLARPGAKA
jgi:UDP-N-acetylmuramoyl-L-alanyl-D-glutamate--2,6-diaminopimelate ligase